MAHPLTVLSPQIPRWTPGRAPNLGETTPMKKWIIALLLCSGAVWADKVTVGTVQKVEVGDYYHLIIKDSKGKQQSYFMGNDKSFEGLVKKPQAYNGKKVRVHWRTINKDIPEAGRKMKIDEATRVEWIKP